MDRLAELLSGESEAGDLLRAQDEAVDGPPDGPDDPDALEDLDELDDPEESHGVGGEGGGGRHRRRRERVPLLSVPESLRSVDLQVGWGAVRGMLLVAVVALLVVGGRWLWVSVAAEGGEPVHLIEEEPGAPPVEAAPTTPAPVEEAGADAGTETGPVVLLVHVAGQVREPGVVEVDTGARVIDVVRQAGGFTAEADQSSLNLARPVLDGEQVWVGRPGEEPPASAGAAAPGSGGAAGSQGGGGHGPGAGGPGGGGGGAGPLDLNQASQADLEELPGVGPVTAERILAWRETNGRFTSVEELLEVSGIGEKTLAQLADQVTVG